jgi:hypothetical protein
VVTGLRLALDDDDRSVGNQICGDGCARNPTADDGDIEIHGIIPVLRQRKDGTRVSLGSTKFHIGKSVPDP